MTKITDDAKLEEVKAILHKLQRIRPDLSSPEPVAPIAAPAKTAPRQERTASRSSDPSQPERAAPKPPGRKSIFAVGSAAALLALAAGGAALFMNGRTPAPVRHEPPLEQLAVTPPAAEPPLEQLAVTPAAEPPPEAQSGPTSVLQEAQNFLAGGDILAARHGLLKLAEDGSPDAAWSLARSYDPNFLRSVANANAGADVEKAEFWYRRWHEVAVKEGLVTDSLRLDRILRSMR